MDSEPRIEHPPRSWTQRLGAILWPSFFSAGVMTMVFFAFVDPLDLRDITFPDLKLEIGRGLGYTICFFMFWAATASSSLFTWILLRPASRFNVPLKDG
ncbi:hypothetical protein [Silanimonas lenta]|jgi:hypothetical protein|uniref:hypothetical protein n=1 Tax=Silanimonas lenta TaxID=265429 RepID=UPI002FE00439